MVNPGLSCGFPAAKAHPLLQALPQPSDTTRMVSSFRNTLVPFSQPACGHSTEETNPSLNFESVVISFTPPAKCRCSSHLEKAELEKVILENLGSVKRRSVSHTLKQKKPFNSQNKTEILPNLGLCIDA